MDRIGISTYNVGQELLKGVYGE